MYVRVPVKTSFVANISRYLGDSYHRENLHIEKVR